MRMSPKASMVMGCLLVLGQIAVGFPALAGDLRAETTRDLRRRLQRQVNWATRAAEAVTHWNQALVLLHQTCRLSPAKAVTSLKHASEVLTVLGGDLADLADPKANPFVASPKSRHSRVLERRASLSTRLDPGVSALCKQVNGGAILVPYQRKAVTAACEAIPALERLTEAGTLASVSVKDPRKRMEVDSHLLTVADTMTLAGDGGLAGPIGRLLGQLALRSPCLDNITSQLGVRIALHQVRLTKWLETHSPDPHEHPVVTITQAGLSTFVATEGYVDHMQRLHHVPWRADAEHSKRLWQFQSPVRSRSGPTRADRAVRNGRWRPPRDPRVGNCQQGCARAGPPGGQDVPANKRQDHGSAQLRCRARPSHPGALRSREQAEHPGTTDPGPEGRADGGHHGDQQDAREGVAVDPA